MKNSTHLNTKYSVIHAIKSIALTVIFIVLMFTTFSQQNIGIGTTTPDSSALLDLNSNNKGLLLPRIALTGSNIWSLSGSKPTDGMIIYIQYMQEAVSMR